MFSLKASSSRFIAVRSVAAQRSISITPAVLSGGSTMHGNNPAFIEKQKQKTLKGQAHSSHEHAPGWNEHLASESEAHVKADKGPAGKPTKDLQSKTVSHLKEHHKDADGSETDIKIDTETMTGSEESVKADRNEAKPVNI